MVRIPRIGYKEAKGKAIADVLAAIDNVKNPAYSKPVAAVLTGCVLAYALTRALFSNTALLVSAWAQCLRLMIVAPFVVLYLHLDISLAHCWLAGRVFEKFSGGK